jgi:hypothetical protein
VEAVLLLRILLLTPLAPTQTSTRPCAGQHMAWYLLLVSHVSMIDPHHESCFNVTPAKDGVLCSMLQYKMALPGCRNSRRCGTARQTHPAPHYKRTRYCTTNAHCVSRTRSWSGRLSLPHVSCLMELICSLWQLSSTAQHGTPMTLNTSNTDKKEHNTTFGIAGYWRHKICCSPPRTHVPAFITNPTRSDSMH